MSKHSGTVTSLKNSPSVTTHDRYKSKHSGTVTCLNIAGPLQVLKIVSVFMKMLGKNEWWMASFLNFLAKCNVLTCQQLWLVLRVQG